MKDLELIFSKPYPRLIETSEQTVLERSENERVELGAGHFPLVLRVPRERMDVRRDIFIAMHRENWRFHMNPRAIQILEEALEEAPLTYLLN